MKCGEFSDPRFRPRPDNYLKNRIWERALRPEKGSKQVSENKIEQAMRRARELEGR
jgi:hypothetical protein